MVAKKSCALFVKMIILQLMLLFIQDLQGQVLLERSLLWSFLSFFEKIPKFKGSVLHIEKDNQ